MLIKQDKHKYLMFPQLYPFSERLQYIVFARKEYMENLNRLFLKHGGIGGRVCGAGGGGSMVWLIDPKRKKQIESILEKQQGKLINFNFVEKGLEVLSI